MFAVLISILVFHSTLVVQRAAMCNPAACLLPKLLGFTEPWEHFSPLLSQPRTCGPERGGGISSFPGKLLGMRVSRSSPTTSTWCLLLTSLLQPELLVSETRQPGREFEWVLRKSS